MKKVVEVKFRDSGKVYYFDPRNLDIAKGDNVIVETARGLVFGDVVDSPRELPDEQIVAPLKPVVRVATSEDREQREYYLNKEKEAFKICQHKIEERGLVMKLVDAEYAFNGSKLTFYFTADSRVDFRELVKDLACVFKTRIDLRQIGVRDEAKKCGGLGSCGRPVCCSAFLTEFMPVSIKMAKSQNLSLNPTKISGICGRLMCCLKYEQDCYETMQKQMPRIGSECSTADGDGVVLENNVITETTKVKVTLADGTLDVRSYPFRELVLKSNGCNCTDCAAKCKGEDCDDTDAETENGDEIHPTDQDA
ncbi:MAG: stage 0 sporulation family protein [Christensenellaceae bacterium]|nr:stage 0 sporulation family protein [Christensenellaceae bacterium]